MFPFVLLFVAWDGFIKWLQYVFYRQEIRNRSIGSLSLACQFSCLVPGLAGDGSHPGDGAVGIVVFSENLPSKQRGFSFSRTMCHPKPWLRFP